MSVLEIFWELEQCVRVCVCVCVCAHAHQRKNIQKLNGGERQQKAAKSRDGT